MRFIKSSFYLIFFIVVLSHYTPTSAQNFKSLCSVEINNIDKSTVDFSGNIYVTSSNGDIRKFNNRCEEVLTFSPTKTGQVKQIDIWSQFKIFGFYENLQEYIILDRFLTSPIRYDFYNLELGYVSNATLNFQQNIWVIDESDFTLKLINIEQQSIITNQPLNQFLDISNHQITHIKEYKGKLYITDAVSGILIFDSFGNYIDRIDAKNAHSINFDSDNFTYFRNGDFIEINLNSLEINTLNAPKGNYNTILKKNDIFYTISNDELEIYQYLRTE